MPKRKKFRPEKWKAVDDKLVKLIEVRQNIGKYQAGFKKRIERAQTDYKLKIQPLVEAEKFLKDSIEQDFRGRAKEVKPYRSIQLAHGRVGLKKRPPSLTVKKKTLGVLKENGMRKYIRKVEEVNKERLLEAPQADLEKAGVRVKQADKFFIELTDDLAVPAE